jgi:single-stranded-DNA-specific exonuclease
VIAPRLEWILPDPIPNPPDFATFGFDVPVATLLARRGISTADRLTRFLDAGPDALHPLSLMADADVALDRIEAAVDNGEGIAIWGDYDADGMSAVAVWVIAMRALGVEPVRYVPSRWSEGYGLSAQGLEKLASAGIRLVVTCDCGVVNVSEVDIARLLGVDVVVTDHHLPGSELPRAVAVVDPHRADCEYPDADLTGAGLAFKLAQALLARRGISTPDLAAIAAVGTVADLAAMTGESRSIVMIGLQELARTRRPGLRALLARAADDPQHPSARDLAYGIAPRINAAGRIAEAELALSLLVADTDDEANRLADELEDVHRRRRELSAATALEARSMLGALPAGTGPALIRHDAWPPGIIGLIAGRLSDDLGRPVAIACATDGELRGSVRAPRDFHVADALEACGSFLTKRGGHAAAGGFSLSPKDWADFAAAFQGLPRPYPETMERAPAHIGAITVDLVLPSRHITWQLAAQIERLAPFGPGNGAPTLAITGMRVSDARRVGPTEAHIAFRMRRGLEAFDAVAFGAPAERPLPEPGSAIDLVGTLERDTFQGIERLRLRVLDYAESAVSPLMARRLPRRAAMPSLAAAS